MGFYIAAVHVRRPDSSYILFMNNRDRRPSCFLVITLAGMSFFLAFSTLSYARSDNCGDGSWCDCRPAETQCLAPYDTCEEACGGWASVNNDVYDDSGERAQRAADRAERAADQRVYDAAFETAWSTIHQGNYREGLELLHKLQKLRNGPSTRRAIKKIGAIVLWTDAKTPADYRKAYKMYPGSFSTENLAWLEEQEATEAADKKAERERPRREAEEKKRVKEFSKTELRAAAQAHKTLDDLSSRLQTPLTPKKDSVRGPNSMDAFETEKAHPLDFGDPTSLEAASDQAQEGWDKPGKLIATPLTVTAPPLPEAESKVMKDPRMIETNQEVARLDDERAHMEDDISRLTKERMTVTDPKRMNDLTAEIDKATNKKSATLVELVKAKEKQSKVHRTIETEVSATTEKVRGGK